MPTLGRKTTKTKKKKSSAVAHFITTAQLAAVKRGEEVKSLCDAIIKVEGSNEWPMCQKCVLVQLATDDRKAALNATERYNAGVTAGETRGVARGRTESMREIREAAERRAGDVKAVAS